MRTLKEIKQKFQYLKIMGANADEIEIHGIGPDSRTVEKGDVFVALNGNNSRGVEWAEKAVEKGAVAILSENCSGIHFEVPHIICRDVKKTSIELADFIYGNPVDSLVLNGITGTNGKTTTAFMLRSIFDKAGYITGMIGTTGHYFPGEVEKAFNTTPPAVELFRIIGKMKNKNVSHLVIEVSSHALTMGRVEKVKFDTVIFSSFGHDHLDWHGDVEKYFEAKLKIFSLMKNDSFACVNSSVGRRSEILQAARKPVYFYSMINGSDYWIEPGESDLKFSTFLFMGEGANFEIELKIPGRINILNAAGAALCALKLGIETHVIKRGLESVEEIPGRMQKIRSNATFSVFVDFAHTPDALENLLSSIKAMKPSRLIAVFGCGGDRDSLKRPLMGKIAEIYSDLIILTDDNPRSEDPDEIISQIENGMSAKPLIIRDRKEAIRVAIRKAKKNDVVVVCGKGHETYQISGDKVIDFDDREEAAAALRELGWNSN
ncbi:UDP-N-acetylmuramoyl-L-alanyl-D-glutamate--2,6-diaminopimelate ligase [candidate division WOR-3 bacterium]|nr:UDP-N-acetylmuramoyl-L-alanyl-D-glutamate--2,6-diaminopimelate ligase [candidate division WOR-3 bacterium]